MADSQVKAANICNITSSTVLRPNAGGSGTYIADNSISVHMTSDSPASGIYIFSLPEQGVIGDKYTISFVPVCVTNNVMYVVLYGTTTRISFTSGNRYTLTITATGADNTMAFYGADNVEKTIIIKDIQIEKGETATVYRPYSATGWVHSLRKLGTATEIIQSGGTIYADGTAATVSLKGNTVQNGTPTPSSPVDVVGVGELEISGEHSGQYKIPILNGQQTTNIYLGSTQTVRQIKKLVLDGTENWNEDLTNYGYRFGLNVSDSMQSDTTDVRSLCTHLPLTVRGGTGLDVQNVYVISASNDLIIKLSNSDRVSDLKTWLAQQYANGTPVTVWYVLVTAETAAVNEPLMKIGAYADSLSNAASIPTTEGANSISIDTTVQPSEVTATWTGWHDASVKEKSENLFDVSTANIGVAWNMDLNNNRATVFLSCEPDTDYCFSSQTTGLDLLFICEKANSSSTTAIDNTGRTYSSPISFTTTSETHCIAVQFNKTNISMQDINNLNSMLNAGSTALPYEPYWD